MGSDSPSSGVVGDIYPRCTAAELHRSVVETERVGLNVKYRKTRKTHTHVCLTASLCSTSRPDVALLWFLIPLKAAKHLVCDQYRWLTIKIVSALLLLAILALFLYNMPGYMVKKMLGA